MKSIKPGRYNSGQGVLRDIVGIVFVVFWIGTAVTMGAPIIFPVMGGGMLLMLVSDLYKNLHNITNKNRYSEFDIVDSDEEYDPMNKRVEHNSRDYINRDYENENRDEYGEMLYCPYCGAKLMGDFKYCPECGMKLPF